MEKKNILIAIFTTYVAIVLTLSLINFIDSKKIMVGSYNNKYQELIDEKINKIGKLDLSEDDRSCFSLIVATNYYVSKTLPNKEISLEEFYELNYSSYYNKLLFGSSIVDDKSFLGYYSELQQKCKFSDDIKKDLSLYTISSIIVPETVLLNKYEFIHELKLLNKSSREMIEPSMTSIGMTTSKSLEGKVILEALTILEDKYE